MKNFLLRTWLMIVCFLAGAGMTWADTFTSKTDLTDLWTSSATVGSYSSGNTGYDGVQFGSKTTPSGKFTLTSKSSFSNVESVTIKASTGGTATITSVTVGGVALGAPANTSISSGVENKNQSYVFTGDGTKSGTIVVTFNASSKAMYVGAIDIVEGQGGGSTGGETKQSYAISFASNNQGSCSATVDGQLIGNGDLVEEGKTVTVSCTPNAGYAFNAWNVYRTGNEHYYVTVSENNTFTMPGAAVTIDAYYIEDSTSGGGTQVTGGTYVLKDLANITATDEVLVVWTPQAGGAYALSNDNGTSAAPTAVSVNVNNGTIVTDADNISWNVSYNANDETFALYPKGSNTTWLYAISDNNGVRVGKGENKLFEIKNGYVYNIGQSRYLGVYSSKDVRCYTTNGGNIANQSVAFYAKVSDEGGDASVSFSVADITVQNGDDIVPVITTNVTGGYLVEYTSDNENVVLADGDELVTMGVGTATITAYFVAGDDEFTTTFTVTVTAAGSTGGVTIPNFIQNTTIEKALNGESYDVRTNLNIPKDYNTETYAITTTINGLTQKDGEYACIYPYLAFEKTGTYPVHVVASATDKYAETTGDFTVVVFDPNEPTVDPDEPTSNVYASLAELVAAGKPTSTARKVTVTLTDEEITKIFVTSQGYRNGIFLQVGEQEIEIYSKNVPEAWLVGGTVSGTLTDCDWKLYSSTWELCPADWSELQYTAPTEVEVQQYAVTYTAPEHGTLVVMNGEEQLESGALVDNGTRVTIVLTPASGYEFDKWEAYADEKVIYTCANDRRDWEVSADVEFKAYFREAYVEPAGQKVTWDLSIDETTDASADHLLWRNNIAMMETVKAKGATNANNYYPGTVNQTYESTRFYTNNSFVVAPASGITINAVVAECTTTGYADKLVGSTWTNATATRVGTSTRVTITPTDGTKAVSAVLGGTTGATSVTVYYTGTSQGWPEVTTYDVNVDGKVVGGTISASAESAEAGTTITLTATPADGYEFTSWKVTLVDDDSAVTVKDNKFTMPEGDVNVSAVFTAQEVTPDVPSEHTFVAEEVWGSTSKQAATMSGTQNGCTMLCKKAPSSSQNCNYVVVANKPNDMRVYANGTVTLFNLTGMNKVVFNISAQGLTRLATITSDSGTIAYDVENATVTWTATTPVKTVTFTVGEKADYGTENTKAGQLDFTSFDVVVAAAQGEIRDVAKYIDGLNLEVKAFSVEELQTIINSTLGK